MLRVENTEQAQPLISGEPRPQAIQRREEPILPNGFQALARVLYREGAVGIARTEQRPFQIPEARSIKALLIAAGIALATVPVQAKPNQQAPPSAPAPTSEAEQSRQALIKLLRRDEMLHAAGMASPAPPTPVEPPWGAIAGLAAVASAVFGAHRLIQKQEASARDAALRQSCVDALGSEYRNVRLDGLAALSKRPDLYGVPIEALLRVSEDPDPAVSIPAKRLVARHPDTPGPKLQALAEREIDLGVRAVALHSMESRRLI